jgi:hypothetical protein
VTRHSDEQAGSHSVSSATVIARQFVIAKKTTTIEQKRQGSNKQTNNTPWKIQKWTFTP